MWSFLFPLFRRAFLRGLQTTTSATCDLNTPYNHAACVPSSKVTRNVPGTPRKNPRTAAASVINTAFITSLPLSFNTAAEILVLCTSRPIHLTSLMRVLLSGVAECSNHCRLLRNGRPFILRGALLVFSMQFQTLSAAQVPRSRAGFAEAGLDRSESLPLLVLSLAEENLGKIGDSLICRILRLTR